MVFIAIAIVTVFFFIVTAQQPNNCVEHAGIFNGVQAGVELIDVLRDITTDCRDYRLMVECNDLCCWRTNWGGIFTCCTTLTRPPSLTTLSHLTARGTCTRCSGLFVV